eukprot:6821240-Karenia_brevis.AAC.1
MQQFRQGTDLSVHDVPSAAVGLAPRASSADGGGLSNEAGHDDHDVTMGDAHAASSSRSSGVRPPMAAPA